MIHYLNSMRVLSQERELVNHHNWLIDPKYKWEDMKTPKDKLDLPQDLAAEFIEDYKRKKLGLTS